MPSWFCDGVLDGAKLVSGPASPRAEAPAVTDVVVVGVAPAGAGRPVVVVVALATTRAGRTAGVVAAAASRTVSCWPGGGSRTGTDTARATPAATAARRALLRLGPWLSRRLRCRRRRRRGEGSTSATTASCPAVRPCPRSSSVVPWSSTWRHPLQGSRRHRFSTRAGELEEHFAVVLGGEHAEPLVPLSRDIVPFCSGDSGLGLGRTGVGRPRPPPSTAKPPWRHSPPGAPGNLQSAAVEVEGCAHAPRPEVHP